MTEKLNRFKNTFGFNDRTKITFLEDCFTYYRINKKTATNSPNYPNYFDELNGLYVPTGVVNDFSLDGRVINALPANDIVIQVSDNNKELLENLFNHKYFVDEYEKKCIDAYKLYVNNLVTKKNVILTSSASPPQKYNYSFKDGKNTYNINDTLENIIIILYSDPKQVKYINSGKTTTTTHEFPEYLLRIKENLYDLIRLHYYISINNNYTDLVKYITTPLKSPTNFEIGDKFIQPPPTTTSPYNIFVKKSKADIFITKTDFLDRCKINDNGEAEFSDSDSNIDIYTTFAWS